MDAESSGVRRGVRDGAGVVAFLLVLFLADWAVHAASSVIFKRYPAAIPDGFFIALEEPHADERGIRHDFVTWKDYASQPGNRTLRLTAPAGRIRSKGDSMSFEVLDWGGDYQLIEVMYDGAYRSYSRYKVFGNRSAVPVAYRGYGWGDPVWSHAAIWAGAVALAGLAMWGTRAVLRRAGAMHTWTRVRKQRIGTFAAIIAFIAALSGTPWIVHLASLAIFKLDPGAAPGIFSVAYRTLDDRYAITGWPPYPRPGAASGFKTFRLPEGGFINGPKVKHSFRVMEADAARQVVEVHTTGVIQAVSRYAVHGERIVPISYRSMHWGAEGMALPPSLIGIALAIAAGWGVFAAAARITRLQES